MRLVSLSVCTAFLFCISCKQENTSKPIEEIEVTQLDSLSKEKSKIALLNISNESKKDLESFKDYQNLANLVQTMQESNPYYIKKYADSLQTMVETFKENIPKHLNKNNISSRVILLITESSLLQELSEKKHPDPQKLIDANTRLLIAYNSLTVQFNELSLAIPENIEKELLKERDIFRDSIPDTDKDHPIIKE